MSETELLPCPYCGTVPKTFPDYGFRDLWSVECGNDDCPWPDEHEPWATDYLPQADAIAAWNSIVSCAAFFQPDQRGGTDG